MFLLISTLSIISHNVEITSRIVAGPFCNGYQIHKALWEMLELSAE